MIAMKSGCTAKFFANAGFELGGWDQGEVVFCQHAG